MKKIKHGHCTNGLSPTYRSWCSMKSRCKHKGNPSYSRYGERGITFCKSWDNFENFLKDMGARLKGTTLGRIDNDGSYNKENCQWETPKQQYLNKTERRSNTGHRYISRLKRKSREGLSIYAVDIPTHRKSFTNLIEALSYRNKLLEENL